MRLQVIYFGIISLVLMSVVAIILVLQFDKLDFERRFKEWKDLKEAERDYMEHRMKRRFFASQHDDYWIFQNYIQADDIFPKNESVTITTHGTYRDLSMLEGLIEYWKSPVSITIFANNVDFNRTLNRIYYLRECSPLKYAIRYFVTFHLCLHKDHLPLYIPKLDREAPVQMNCTKRRHSFESSDKNPYWVESGLDYPVNLLRNVARQSALSYYIMPMELGLLPSEYLMRDFLLMVRNLELYQYQTSVYCLPIVSLEAFKRILLRNHNKTRPQSYLTNEMIARRHQLFIDEIHKKREISCEAYITINEFQPNFDEQIPTSCLLTDYPKPNVLEILNYNFINLRGTVIGRYSHPDYVNVYKTRPVLANCSQIYQKSKTQWKLLFQDTMLSENVY